MSLTVNNNAKTGGQYLQTEIKSGTKRHPLVTVITSVLNDVNNIENAIKSVIKQTYTLIEYIIIDAESNDGTLEIIKKYDSFIDYWISEPDTGIYEAWNKALNKANGEWILFLGADDLLKPDGIESLINVAINAQNSLEYVSGKTEIIRNNILLRITGEPWSWNKFRRYVCTGHIGAIHNRSLFIKYGMYDTSYRIAGDYEFLLRAGKNLKAGYADKVTATMKMGGVSNESSKVIWETYNAQLKNGATSKFNGLKNSLISLLKWYAKKILNQI